MGVHIKVYGAKRLCASCVGAPDSKGTYEWLQAAIARKFADNQAIYFEYIDIDFPTEDESDKHFIDLIHNDELFYPAVTVNGELVSEGNPRLKVIYNAIDREFAQNMK